MRTTRLLAAIILAACAARGWAGPPFITDDPEPVDYRHWEVYISSITIQDPTGSSGTEPHIEVNNGIVPNVQLHIIMPSAYDRPPGGPTSRGYGDTEVGVVPLRAGGIASAMVGIFPLFELPTGSAEKGLGTGYLHVFIPVWLQKSWGPWTSYGGGGYFINPGPGNLSYSYVGFVLQKDFSKLWTLGGELFHTTATIEDGSASLNFNLGGQYNFDDGHHILFSACCGILGGNQFMKLSRLPMDFRAEGRLVSTCINN